MTRARPPLPQARGPGAALGDRNSGLPLINRRIAIDAAALIKEQKNAEAAALLQDAESELRLFAQRSRLELWDGRVAQIMRLIDLRREALAKANTGGTSRPAGATPRSGATIRLTPDENRALAAIRTELNTAGTLIRTGKLVEAQTALSAAQKDLSRLVAASRLPVWSVPIASAYQLAATRRGELKGKRADLDEAREKAAAAAQAARSAASQPGEQHPRSGLPVGAPAPPFAAVTLDGQPFTTQQLKGKWVLLDFWATWCGPCRAEMPHIRAAYDAFAKDDRLVVLSLSQDGQIETAAAFAQQNQMTWPQGFIGEDSPVLGLYNVNAIPTLIVINPEGKVAAVGLRGAAIKQKLTTLLGAAPATPSAKQ